jgi:8-oxo-dGTP pyrophosphatase MutT (NUDIX family)
MPNRVQFHAYSSAGGFVVRDGQMLLVRKRLQPEVRMPKGHIEPGEDRAQAALREVTEETGYAGLHILADLGHQTAEFVLKPRWIVRDESAFLMTLENETQTPRDAKDTERFDPIWVPATDAPTLLTFRTEQEFARRALAWLAEHAETIDDGR